MQQVFICQNLLKKLITNLKSNVDKLDVDILKNLSTKLRNLKSKVDKLVPVPVDLSKLSDVVKKDFVKEMHIMLR